MTIANGVVTDGVAMRWPAAVVRRQFPQKTQRFQASGQDGDRCLAHRIPKGYEDAKWTTLDEGSFAQVPEENEAQVLGRLEQASFISVGKNEAEKLTGGKLKADEGMFFVLRGVSVNEGTGRFSVEYRESTVVVRHDSLGHPGIANRRAIVAVLPIEPKRAFAATAGAL